MDTVDFIKTAKSGISTASMLGGAGGAAAGAGLGLLAGALVHKGNYDTTKRLAYGLGGAALGGGAGYYAGSATDTGGGGQLSPASWGLRGASDILGTFAGWKLGPRIADTFKLKKLMKELSNDPTTQVEVPVVHWWNGTNKILERLAKKDREWTTANPNATGPSPYRSQIDRVKQVTAGDPNSKGIRRSNWIGGLVGLLGGELIGGAGNAYLAKHFDAFNL